MTTDLETHNARIESTFLGREDHGIPTCFVRLKFERGTQTFGGYDLRAHGYDFIDRILVAVGVEKWEDLRGQMVRIKAEHVKVHAIGHIIEDRWFCPAEDLPS